ncbi:MAG: divalent-cation tolerance protein CutA [Burkholderia sp.]|nr:divalent-cation tolerance protein CutA [Burkholderia sp.]
MIVVLILTTVSDTSDSLRLINGALNSRLAACVSDLGIIRSHYYWKDKIEIVNEIQLLFKTSASKSLDLKRFILKNHPYDTPEIVLWQADTSYSYGKWLEKETQF